MNDAAVRRRWPGHLVSALRVSLLVAACWALRRELAGMRPADLLARLGSYGASRVALGLACTVASFLVLGAIEIVALRHAGDTGDVSDAVAPVPARVALVTAFVANAFSQSIGLALLTGAAVRMRAYARRGLDGAAVARVTAFVTLTATLGLLAAGAVALLASPSPLRVHGFSLSTRPIGVALTAVVALYLAWSALGRAKSLGMGRWRLGRPSLGLALAQLALAALDWLLTGTVLYAFLPATLGVGFWALLRAYMVAQTVGVTSHVPAGAGVLELVVIALLTDGAPAAIAPLVTSLVMFRVVYYLLPLVAAMAVAGIAELRRPSRAALSLVGAHAR